VQSRRLIAAALPMLLAWCAPALAEADAKLNATRARAESGDAAEQSNLGVLYNDGRGVPQDYTEAVKWYRKSAEQGNAAGQANLGTMYSAGRGVPLNYGEAVKWFRKATEQGNASGQFNLGAMYDAGRGVPQCPFGRRA